MGPRLSFFGSTALAIVLAGCQLAGLASRPSTRELSATAAATATSAPTTTSPTPPTPTASPTPAFDVVAVGDVVTASGQVLITKDGSVTLCSGLIRLAIFAPSDPFCANGYSSVKVSGLDLGKLDLWQEVNLRVSDYLRIFGTWNGKGIDATSTEPARRTGYPPRLVPCPAPRGGWQSYPEWSVPDDVTNRLDQAVDARPDLYSGVWIASIDDTDQVALVVGTVGDVDTEAARLAQMYPYNLCVFAVDFSSADLHRIEQELETNRRAWQSGIDVTTDRIRVGAQVVDASIAEGLAPYADAIVVESTVVHAP